MTVKLREIGNSMTVTIPKDIVVKLGLAQGMEAEIKEKNNTIMVEPILPDKKITMKSLFADYNGNYISTEIDWGENRGNEVW